MCNNRGDFRCEERGAGILEVIIAFALLAIASLGTLAVYERQAQTVVGVAQEHRAFSVLAAGTVALRTASNVQNLNGSTWTATSAPSGVSTVIAAPVESALAEMPNAQLQWQIQPIAGSVCPCTVRQTLQWGTSPTAPDHSVTVQTVVDY